MATPTQTAAGSAPDQAEKDALQHLRELYAQGPELGLKALDNVLGALAARPPVPPGRQVVSAGRVGLRQGQVSELTMIIPLAPGGATRLRALLALLDGNFDGADLVGTVHDMRFVFLDDDTLLFCTAYDGDWDAYIDDFVVKIPDYMDVLVSCAVGWPGIRSPQVKDWLLTVTRTADAWYVASPDLTVVGTRRLERNGKALDAFLDKISD